MTTDVKYSTGAYATGGGRNGLAGLDDGKLTVRMASPAALGGDDKGHNPEELFAIGYAACFLGAMRFAASSENLGTVPDDATVHSEVGIGPRSDGGFGLTVKLKVSMPDTDRGLVEKIVERGHFICPYSNATQGNIDVTTEIA
ncbi:organic hydroperoxide resistance protein [Pontivivens insulae]|uniref:Organic hydroperoxide resistance protein OhrB n=1 Tax=Pontivivens insulae TaxID=1639689 RepID=A0A2R8AAH6_9RHOB|nr:organic hydroperoxide resistance protein [Pontivivens insulae]RED13134.1 Ohr subfamily peroxiredoxin [Pontivivens insulae]SPF29226.1 Organic hydroperoxide resistance protein OhrB [Pontivivens insulae]